MSPRILLVACCCMLVLALATLVDANVHHRQPSGEVLQRRASVHHTAAAHALAPTPAPAPSHPPSHSHAHWSRSVYHGVDRASTREGDLPGQVKLAFIPGGVSVSWSTQHSYPCDYVQYGATPSSMTSLSVSSPPRTYGTLWFWTALLPSLGSGARVYYEVCRDGVVRSFEAPLAPGDVRPFTTLVVGDMGLVNSANTMLQLRNALNETDFILHIGDLSYADDFVLRPNDTYEGSWDEWQDRMEPITSVKPYMTLPGNHEAVCQELSPTTCPPQQNNFTAYNHRFRMPSVESGATPDVQNMWYSYDYGMVHFIQIDTETDYPDSKMGPGTDANAGPFGDQLTWLKADLQKAQAARADGSVPWIVVSGHRPFYGSGKKCHQCQAAFEDIMLQYGVDVYLAGHVHWYERLWPIADGQVTQQNYDNPTGMVHIINGAAGNVEGHKVNEPGDMSAFSDATDFGFGKLNVINATTIQWQFFRATDASLVDEITITQQH